MRLKFLTHIHNQTSSTPFSVRITVSANTVGSFYQPTNVFKAHTMTCDVKGPNIVVITQLLFSNIHVLACKDPVDAWLFSEISYQQVLEAFLKQHNLIGKTSYEVDRYLDEQSLSMPTRPILHMPALTPVDRINIIGEFKETVTFTFSGVAYDYIP